MDEYFGEFLFLLADIKICTQSCNFDTLSAKVKDFQLYTIFDSVHNFTCRFISDDMQFLCRNIIVHNSS
jgi:hypothetical protein